MDMEQLFLLTMQKPNLQHADWVTCDREGKDEFPDHSLHFPQAFGSDRNNFRIFPTSGTGTKKFSRACTHSELECNDSNPEVNPGMDEIPGNGIDDVRYCQLSFLAEHATRSCIALERLAPEEVSRF